MTQTRREDEDEVPNPEANAFVGEPQFDPEEERVFGDALRVMNAAGVPYVLAGAFAKYAYTGIWRDTKDLDIFLLPDGLKDSLAALEAAGFTTSIEQPHWLAKARRPPYFVDLIFGIGHGRVRFDESWFARGRWIEVAGVPVRLIPLEELIVSKVYIAERYRFDTADVLHLIQRSQGKIDWQRVLALLGPHRQLLLWHLILFDFVYPGHRGYLPQELMARLFESMRRRWQGPPEDPHAFRGTLIDPFSFLPDIDDWGYADRRDLEPLVDDEGELL